MAKNPDYISRLESFVNSGEADKLIKQAKQCLIDDKNTDTLPAALATRMVNESPDIFVSLLLWLRHCECWDSGSESHLKLLGVITALSWFGGDAKTKQAIVKRILEGASIPELIKEERLPVLLHPDRLRELIIEAMVFPEYRVEEMAKLASEKEDIGVGHQIAGLEKEKDELKIWLQRSIHRFLNCVMWGAWPMLLYAQRKYVNSKFQAYGQWEMALEDTNCPWDWDHIYPRNYAYHKGGVPRMLKYWYGSVGNFRVEALESNRKNQDEPPSEKLSLKDTRDESFISEDDWNVLKKVTGRVRDETQAKEIVGWMLMRAARIYEEWYDKLRIDKIQNSSNLELFKRDPR